MIHVGDEREVDALVEEIEVTRTSPRSIPRPTRSSTRSRASTTESAPNWSAALLADEVPHGWDEDGNLVVLQADEDTAAAVLDRIDAGRKDRDAAGGSGNGGRPVGRHGGSSDTPDDDADP